MLWGHPGVGKSQGVREIAAEIEKQTGRDVRITDVRLLLFNPLWIQFFTEKAQTFQKKKRFISL